jgi:hypothetical protein
MRSALLLKRSDLVMDRLEASGALPPRDRTSRTEKAVELCRSEWQSAYEVAKSKGYTASRALRMASVAYKLAMPKMDSLPAIKAAIACIAQGIALEVFDGRDGSQLLYAAQVALTVFNQKRRQKA